MERLTVTPVLSLWAKGPRWHPNPICFPFNPELPGASGHGPRMDRLEGVFTFAQSRALGLGASGC